MKGRATRRANAQRAASISVCGIVVAGLLYPQAARAAWDFVPDIAIGAETEENPRLNPDTQVTNTSTAVSMNLDASATIANFNERGFLTFQPRLMSYRYSDESDSDLESNDWYFTGTGEYRWQTVRSGFRGDFGRERLLSSELVPVDLDDDPDTDDPDTGDTGRLAFINQNRERYYFNPWIAFRVSERNTLRFDATKYEHTYSGGNRVFRTGYSNDRFALSLVRNVDERNTVTATMSVDEYEAPGTENNTDTVTIEGAFSRPVTQLWTLNLGVGVLRSDFEFAEPTPQQQLTSGATTDYTMRVGLRRRQERSRINLDFVRNVWPSASGYASLRREVRVWYDRLLTQRLNARFGVRINETGSVASGASFDDRQYARGEIAFQWAIRQTLFLDAGYNYTAQDFTDDLIEQRTNSSSIYIGMSYRGLSRR